MTESSNPATWFRTFGRSKSALQPTTATTNTNPSPSSDRSHEPPPPTMMSTHLAAAPSNNITITASNYDEALPPTPATPTPEGSPSRLRMRPAAAVRRVSSFLSLAVGGSSPKQESQFSSNSIPARVAPMGALPLSGFHSSSGTLTGDDYGGLTRLMGGMGVGGRRGEEESIVWSRPNMMQMVETLRGVMMGVMRAGRGEMGGREVKRGKGEREEMWERVEREMWEGDNRGDGEWGGGTRGERGGLPVEYNSHVLVLLEGFGHLVEQLRKTREDLAELKNLREKEVEQFRGISEEWIQRENGYKAEIKRLELVLAKESKDGLASVALARHGSLINRSGTKRFQARLKRMSSSQDVDNAREAPIDPGPNVVEAKEAKSRYETIGDIPRDLNPHSDVLMSRLVERQDRDYSYRYHLQGQRGSNQLFPSPDTVNQQTSPSTHRNLRNEDPEYPTPGEAIPRVRATKERQPWYGKGQESTNEGPNSHPYVGLADRLIADPLADESSASSRWEAESSTSDDSLADRGSPSVRPQPRRSNDSGPGLFDGTNSRLADNGLVPIHEGTGHLLNTVFQNHHGDWSTVLNPALTSPYLNRDQGLDGQEASTQQTRSPLDTRGSQSAVDLRRRPSPHLNRGYSFKRGDDEHLPVTSPTHRKAKGPDSDSMYLYTPTPQDHVSSVRSDCVGSPSTKRPGLAPSTSTGSVIWRGNDDRKATISRRDDDRTPRASTCEYHGEDSDGGSQQ